MADGIAVDFNDMIETLKQQRNAAQDMVAVLTAQVAGLKRQAIERAGELGAVKSERDVLKDEIKALKNQIEDEKLEKELAGLDEGADK